MTEETLFAEAIEKSTPAERAAFLDSACGGDAALRQRVEALLQSHARVDFLRTPAIQRAAEVVGGSPIVGATEAEVHGNNPESALDFLVPSEKPGSLGRLGHYEVREIIGRGGMGIVLRAVDEKLQRVVAIKVMAAQLATNATARKRFTREAQAQAAVSHDHIVTIHAVDADSQLPHLVMQYISGMSLQERLDKSGPMQLHEILRIGMQTASGLAAAHAQGLVHRDIKPANILLENGVERVKITDFGLARAATEASLTQSGVAAGTPQYMSPEQAEGKAIDQRTDLFSLATVLYAMCTGRAPFRASESMAVLKRVCEETPRPIRETNPDIPDWLVAVIDKLHAKDPAGRYQTAAEVAALLNQHLAHLQHPSVAPLPVTKPAKPPAAGRRRIVAALFVACLAAGLIIGGAALLGVFSPEPTPDGKNGPEGKTPPSVRSTKPEPHPFVVLGGKGVAESKFGTLAEAVQRAIDGDTIEIRGNGPFVTPPIKNFGPALTIRASAGFRPVIKPSLEGIEKLPLFVTNAALTLEGLEFQVASPEDWKSPRGSIQTAAPIRAVNCRFRSGIWTNRSPACVFRNCEFHSDGLGHGIGHRMGSGARVIVENCVYRTNSHTMLFNYENADVDDVLIRITRSTFACKNAPLALSIHCPLLAGIDGPQASKPIRLEVSRSVFDSSAVLAFRQQKDFTDKAETLPPPEADAILRRLMQWQGERNVLPVGSVAVDWYVEFKRQPPHGPKDLGEWEKFWGSKEANSREGRLRFQGGNLLSRSDAEVDQLTPEDFRLRSDSDGYKAGNDKKDLGADVDQVGPGQAYERWKKAPEYQQWLKETGQVRK